MTTTGDALLDALQSAGVSFLFANFGSDHPAILESLAERAASGRPTPRVITCPNEMVALTAAHGCAQLTGEAQAVLVHVDCGTQALAGAVHNAAKARIPVLIVAGASPFTQEGEMKGSRNEFIHWLQDVFDQRGLVRGYVKYENEIRTGRNVHPIVHRALQLARSDPRGPAYLVAAREVMEEDVTATAVDPADWAPLGPAALPPAEAAAIAAELAGARRPLVVTSYLGRNPAAVDELVRLCGRLGAGVLESAPSYLNYPTSDPLYQGSVWNEQRQNRVLAGADVVLVVDSDVPWIPSVSRPGPDARIIHIDVDPLKQQMPLWYIPARRRFRADAAVALGQINAELDRIGPSDGRERAAYHAALHEERRGALLAREQAAGDEITPAYLTSRVRRLVDETTVVLSEGITNYHTIADHMGMTRPGSFFASGGTSLGWSGGAALGMKLARPDRTVIALTGDGSYLFQIPSVVHWMARRYDAPFLTVVYNNGGWRAPRFSALTVHPAGYISRTEDLGLDFAPVPDYAGIAAAAGGAFARTVRKRDELDAALEAALHAVRTERRSAVLDVAVLQA